MLSSIARSIRTCVPRSGDDLADCVLVVGSHDALAPPDVVDAALESLAISEINVVKLATGGHYPHVESVSHPEWTARNIAHIVEVIDSMLVACRDGTLLSTAIAPTTVSDAASAAGSGTADTDVDEGTL